MTSPFDLRILWIYALLRQDLMRAYVGVSGNPLRRVDAHRHINRDGLWDGGISPRFFILHRIDDNDLYAPIERTWRELLVLDGWAVPHAPSWEPAVEGGQRPKSFRYFEDEDLDVHGEVSPEYAIFPSLRSATFPGVPTAYTGTRGKVLRPNRPLPPPAPPLM